jgi:ectoine hydroxylase-related dioxygenase (phytanoyl-CoA dioxygenase family)
VVQLGSQQIDDHIAAISQNGYTILVDAIDEELLERIRTELDRLEWVRPGGDIAPAPFSGYVTRRWFDLLNDDDVWQQVAVHPWVLPIMTGVLGDGFLLSTMGTAVIGPAEKAQPIHVDDGVYGFPRPHPDLVCNTMWAVEDFTVENGATRVVPGSNNLECDPDFRESYKTVPLTMKAGSIAFVVGSCYHGAGANQTDRDRVGLTINYCNGAMRQQENLMLGVHPERVMTFPAALQDILGFRMCGGAGHLFASDPRSEMMRHYGAGNKDEGYLRRRNGLHAQRLAAQKATRPKG